MPKCPHCGLEMNLMDLNGNEGLFCPNECEFFADYHSNPAQDASDAMAMPILDSAILKSTHCWNCRATVLRKDTRQDGHYGHFCPECGESLRNNPLYGVGRKLDLGKK